MASATASAVAEGVKRVQDAHRAGVYTLSQKIPQTEQVKNWTGGLRSLGEPIAKWSQRGTEGADRPATFDLGKWLKAGDIHLAGINELVGGGESSTMADLASTAKDVKDDTKKVAKAVAKTVKNAAIEVAGATGEAVGKATAPLLPLLGIIAVGLVAVVALKFGRSK